MTLEATRASPEIRLTPKGHGGAIWLYLINAVLLMVHEIDSAYWHEWELLGIPGGNQGFLLFHLPLLALVLIGFRRVVIWHKGAKFASFALATVGIGAVALHATLILRGNPEFQQPVSLVILAGILVASGSQLWAAYGMRAPADAER